MDTILLAMIAGLMFLNLLEKAMRGESSASILVVAVPMLLVITGIATPGALISAWGANSLLQMLGIYM